MKHGKLLLEWDNLISDYAVEQRIDEHKETLRQQADNDMEQFIRNGGKVKDKEAFAGSLYKEYLADDNYTSDKAMEEIGNDTDYWQFQYDDLLYQLSEIIKTKNINGYWKATMDNFGWLHQNGYKYFTATTGQDLLTQILPQTDCQYRIYQYGKGLAIQNFHHDSPTGNEWYYITPVNETTYERQVV